MNNIFSNIKEYITKKYNRINNIKKEIEEQIKLTIFTCNNYYNDKTKYNKNQYETNKTVLFCLLIKEGYNYELKIRTPILFIKEINQLFIEYLIKYPILKNIIGTYKHNTRF